MIAESIPYSNFVSSRFGSSEIGRFSTHFGVAKSHFLPCWPTAPVPIASRLGGCVQDSCSFQSDPKHLGSLFKLASYKLAFPTLYRPIKASSHQFPWNSVDRITRSKSSIRQSSFEAYDETRAVDFIASTCAWPLGTNLPQMPSNIEPTAVSGRSRNENGSRTSTFRWVFESRCSGIAIANVLATSSSCQFRPNSFRSTRPSHSPNLSRRNGKEAGRLTVKTAKKSMSCSAMKSRNCFLYCFWIAWLSLWGGRFVAVRFGMVPSLSHGRHYLEKIRLRCFRYPTTEARPPTSIPLVRHNTFTRSPWTRFRAFDLLATT